MKKIFKRGFTLIEILVVIGIIAILAAIVIIAINPARQFAQARDSQRQSNVESILNALGQNLADNKGVSTCTGITNATSTIGTGSNNVNLSSCLGPYLPGGIPMDPGTSDSAHGPGSASDTGYTVYIDSATGRYVVCAPNAEYETAISSSQPMICVER